ncbi:hypothetical protein KC878_01845 [Candidatus Saccharibacteria bacterium]|nr:hypothetical protein [Candidatus Saccharibacteria bacterium]MCB9821622.1 hypothetical protein [Candidatus Nomurabacteria bacterium]
MSEKIYGTWVDQQKDTGSGLIEEIAPSLFMMLRDGRTYAHRNSHIFGEMLNGLVVVEDTELDLLVEAAEEDPCKCVMIEEVKLATDGTIEFLFHDGLWVPYCRSAPTNPFILNHNASQKIAG